MKIDNAKKLKHVKSIKNKYEVIYMLLGSI